MPSGARSALSRALRRLPLAARARGVRFRPWRGPAEEAAGFRLFAGLWTSRVPGFEAVTGADPLFEDPRVDWAAAALGGVGQRSVLELGPLEGAHTARLEALGARVTAVEADTGAFLRSLVVKNALGLKASFLLGDALGHLEGCDARYDLVFASGVLYHMADPLALLRAIARVTGRLYLWTHVFDRDAAAARRLHFPSLDGTPVERDGLTVTYHRRRYLPLRWGGFCGGTGPWASWLSRDDLERALEHYGLEVVAVGHETADHPHGPCLSLAAVRAPGAPPPFPG